MGKRKPMLPTAAWFVSAFGEESEERRQAEVELRAAEAVIRAAMKAGPYVSTKDDLAMGRALARLSRVTGAKGGRK